MMKFGLTEDQIGILEAIFDRHNSQFRVLVYGSRAKGNYSKASDLDLVVDCEGDPDLDLLEEIKDEIIESDFPYLVDLQYIRSIRSSELLSHIERIGMKLF